MKKFTFTILHGNETCSNCGYIYHIQDYSFCPKCGKK